MVKRFHYGKQKCYFCAFEYSSPSLNLFLHKISEREFNPFMTGTVIIEKPVNGFAEKINGLVPRHESVKSILL